MKRMIGSMAVLFFALLAGAAPAQEKINISIGTGGTGGVYYPMGGGLANILSKSIAGNAGDRGSDRRLGRTTCNCSARASRRSVSRW